MTEAKKTIALLPGDGIGPEVIRAAALVLEDCAAEFGHRFTMIELPIGGPAIAQCGTPLPVETLNGCRAADAILLGAVRGSWNDELPLNRRPEAGLLELRSELGLYADLRSIRLRESRRAICPLKAEGRTEIDLEIVRELAGGFYFGEHRWEQSKGDERPTGTATYATSEVERLARFAFTRAAGRRKRLASVDKANVAASALWRKTVDRVATNYPDVSIEHLDVDNAARQLLLRPEQFDIILTPNLFGDILSDQTAGLVGSIGMIPSMSLGSGPPLFQPTHGSAPRLAGKDQANPMGAILCVSMMLREAFGLGTEADWIEAALDRVLENGFRTADIADQRSTVVSCTGFVELVHDEMGCSAREIEQYGWGV